MEYQIINNKKMHRRMRTGDSYFMNNVLFKYTKEHFMRIKLLMWHALSSNFLLFSLFVSTPLPADLHAHTKGYVIRDSSERRDTPTQVSVRVRSVGRSVFFFFFLFNGCGIIVYAWPQPRGCKVEETIEHNRLAFEIWLLFYSA